MGAIERLGVEAGEGIDSAVGGGASGRHYTKGRQRFGERGFSAQHDFVLYSHDAPI